jgi:hypothetical protein
MRWLFRSQNQNQTQTNNKQLHGCDATTINLNFLNSKDVVNLY